MAPYARPSALRTGNAPFPTRQMAILGRMHPPRAPTIADNNDSSVPDM